MKSMGKEKPARIDDAIPRSGGTGLRVALAASLALSLPFSASIAQDYPARAVRIVVPFAAGGGVDAISRAFGHLAGERVGQRIIIENRPGAEGVIGTEMVARSPPDGYVLLMMSSGHWMLPAVRRKLPYDPVRDFSPISKIVSYPMMLLVHPSLPAFSVRQLVQLGKGAAGRLNYASSGAFSQLTTEKFKQMSGMAMTRIPYKGGAPALADLAAGQVEVMFNVILAGMPYVRSGRLRALAVTSLRRLDALPDLPTVAESGYPGFVSIGGAGLALPAGSPNAITGFWHREVGNALKTDAFRRRLLSDGGETVGNSPAEFAEEIAREIQEWTRVARAAGIEMD